MVSPRFSNYLTMSNPFYKNAVPYIKVQNPKTEKIRDCRWYSHEEYVQKYVPADKTVSQNVFADGPILLIRGDYPNDRHLPWFKYDEILGFHLRTTDTLPHNAPTHFRYLLLTWDDIKNDPTAKSVSKVIRNKIKNGQYIPFK